MPAGAILATTIPMVVAGAVVTKVVKQTIGGKPVGSRHYHYKGGKPTSHKHEGGHIAHSHRGWEGYGKTRKSLKRW